MSRDTIRAALWDALIEHAEVLHQVAILGQRRATKRTAAQLERLADELGIMARAINLLARRGLKS